jgi:hypothetical protein
LYCTCRDPVKARVTYTLHAIAPFAECCQSFDKTS